MSEVVNYALREGIGVISVNSPPHNALSRPVRIGLLDCLQQGLADSGARALLVMGEGSTFPAGADLGEFREPLEAPGLGEVINAFEDSEKLVVAAIHGTALGGGLELALGCHYRIALSTVVVGLPEVKLGVLPGAGGTQRLPRLIGVEAALEMLIVGDRVKAARARKLGIVDVVVDNNLMAGATLAVNRLVKHEAALHRVREMEVKPDSATLFEDVAKRLASQTDENPAPMRCVQAVQAALDLPFDEGLKREHELFMELVQSPPTAARLERLAAEGKGLVDL